MNICRAPKPFLAILAILPLSIQAAHHWEITDFEVFLGKPYMYNDTWYKSQLALGLDPDEPIELCQEHNQRTCDVAVATLKSYLHDVAVELERIGFADPTADGIDAIVTDYNGRKKVRVYLFDFVSNEVEDKLAFFANPCDKVFSVSVFGNVSDSGKVFRRMLLLDSRDMFRGGVVAASGIQSAGHELFHAVQFASNFRKGPNACKVTKWISEGTADAVGFYLSKKLRNLPTTEWDKLVGSKPAFAKPWGMRRYHKPLSMKFPGSSEDYQTMSFWRHLAEWDYAKGNGKDHPGSAKAPEQYFYLVDLFSRPFGTPGMRNDVRWLESWMKTYTTMGSGLAPIYSQFAASIADHMTSRIPPIEDLDASERIPRWLKFLFEPCPKVTLSHASPDQPAKLSIEPVASRCVSVEIQSAIPGPVMLVIENSDVPNAHQKQLRVGFIGGQLVSKADVRIAKLPARDAGTSYAKWQFLATAGQENFLVFSNVAETAGDTAPVSGEFQFSIPSWGSSMTTQQPASPGQGQGGPPKTRKAVQNYQKSLRTNPTTHSLAAALAGTDFNPPPMGCTGDLQLKNLCGPQLSISLSLDYGFMAHDGPTASAGGLLKQLGGLNMSGPGEGAQAAAQISSMSSNLRGSLVTLSIPAVDYGYSGATTNARIEVVGNEGRSYQALHTSPDDNGAYPPSGVVNITKYTPHILKGTFSGSLVEYEDIRKATRDNPVLPISENIEGHFVVAAPWRGNAAVPETGMDSSFMTGAREDMLDFLLKLPPEMRSSMVTGDMLEKLCQMGFEDGQLSSLGLSGSCASSQGGVMGTIQQCDCSCNVYEQMKDIPLCQAQCEVSWEMAQCAAKAKTQTKQRDEEAERYIADLATLGLEASMFETQAQAFRGAPQHLRVKMWSDLDILREQFANPEMQQLKVQRAEDRQYDEETMHYKAALESAGKTDAEVNGLVTLFSISDPQIRQILWDDLGGSDP